MFGSEQKNDDRNFTTDHSSFTKMKIGWKRSYIISLCNEEWDLCFCLNPNLLKLVNIKFRDAGFYSLFIGTTITLTDYEIKGWAITSALRFTNRTRFISPAERQGESYIVDGRELRVVGTFTGLEEHSTNIVFKLNDWTDNSECRRTESGRIGPLLCPDTVKIFGQSKSSDSKSYLNRFQW